jgi:hypothetical protein
MRRTSIIPLAALMLAAGCGSGDRSGIEPHLAAHLRTARAFMGFPLYWAGPQLGKLPLVAVSRAPEHFGEGFTFIYGTCVASGSGDESGCSPPMEIQVTNLCNRLPKDLGIRHLLPRRMRGALTSAAEAGADNGPDISLYAHGATITIYGASRTLNLAAVAALRGANGLARGQAGQSLPAASKREIAGAGC